MIKLEQIFAGYGKKTVLNDISLDISKGQLISIVGANGSGKSTLLKCMTGLIPCSSGGILLEDKLLKDLSRQEIARRISFLPQGKQVSDMTVKQMVLHGRFPHLNYPRRYSKRDKEIAMEAIQQMGLAEHAEELLPTLSGGMRQKAYIAMALAQETEYILLDEPTTYLDVQSQIELMHTLRGLVKQGKTIVTVMHDLPLAFSYSDWIVIIDDGSVVASDIPEKICQEGWVDKKFGVKLRNDINEGSYYLEYKREN